MDNKVKVWTKQHEDILKDLELNRRYIVKKEYIINKMEEHASLYLDVYNWYYQAASKLVRPPENVLYPIWVSLTEEGKITSSPGNVELEIEVEQAQLITMDIDKWGRIVNYMYIPANDQDEKEHAALLARYRIDDCTAYMTSFYPNIKRKIIKSWDRLFDESIILSKVRVGTIWELRKEWILGITR
ncbi:hypothetical protein SRRS_46110 [Sporomusa rhizae]|uniref:DUF3841 domain-containing protein n=1 Tax=Sporomusa rhizae TaxID=357999 RepID=UPI00352AC39E